MVEAGIDDGHEGEVRWVTWDESNLVSPVGLLWGRVSLGNGEGMRLRALFDYGRRLRAFVTLLIRAAS